MDRPNPNARPEVAREFWKNVIMLGEFALDSYMAEVRNGTKTMDFAEINDIKANIATCKAELKKIK
jgi:hypothetical protein